MTLPDHILDIEAPHPDLEAERALLSSVLSDPERFDDVASISSEDFVDPGHALLWSTIRAVFDLGQVPEVAAVVLRLKESGILERVGRQRLSDLATAGVSGANKKTYAEKVRSQAFSRHVSKVAEHTQERIRGGMTPEMALDLQRQEVEGLSFAYAQVPGAVAAKFAWRTLTEIEAAAAANPREFLWNGFVATGAVSVIAGEPKAGKSEIMAAFIAAVTRGWAWMGHARPAARVVLISEEGDHDLIAKMRKYGVDESMLAVLSRDADMTGGTWTELVLEGVRKAQEICAVLLVIDTLSFWAGLVNEEERNESVMKERLTALQPARAAGLATMLSHHTAKSTEVTGIASLRGSGAFAANVEAVGVYKRYGPTGTTQRKLEMWTRWPITGNSIMDRVQPEGETPTFVLVNPSDSDSATAQTDQKIIAALKKTQAWLTKAALMEATGMSKSTLDPRLPELAERGTILRMGSGSRSSLFVYAARGVPAPSKE